MSIMTGLTISHASAQSKPLSSFTYSEATIVANGVGSYLGYTDSTNTTGSIQTLSQSGNVVTSHFQFQWFWADNQGDRNGSSDMGVFTWNSSSFRYLNATDDQVGYTNPRVWFAMPIGLAVGNSFYLLNTKMNVLSTNYMLLLPNGSKIITVQTQGTGIYQRDDSYGVFNATYTYTSYYDPTSGFIVGYNYVEQDNGIYQGVAGSFTYSDNLFVTATSYTLSTTVVTSSQPPMTTPTIPLTTSSYSLPTSVNVGISSGDVVIAVGVIIVIVVIIALIARGRKDDTQPPPSAPAPKPIPPSPPASAQQAPLPPVIPTGQPIRFPRPNTSGQTIVVEKQIPVVKCPFCGTLVNLVDEEGRAATNCPHCGAPTNKF